MYTFTINVCVHASVDGHGVGVEVVLHNYGMMCDIVGEPVL